MFAGTVFPEFFYIFYLNIFKKKNRLRVSEAKRRQLLDFFPSLNINFAERKLHIATPNPLLRQREVLLSPFYFCKHSGKNILQKMYLVGMHSESSGKFVPPERKERLRRLRHKLHDRHRAVASAFPQTKTGFLC